MSHEVTQRADGSYEAIFSEADSWWKSGRVSETVLTAAEAIVGAQLNWPVEGLPILYRVDNELKTAKEFKANVRMDTKECLGVVRNRYRIMQNVDSFDFLDSLIGDDLQYESAFSLFGGKQVVVSARLKGDYFVSKDDPLVPYIVIANAHDASISTTIYPTDVRTVCNNTFRFGLQGAKQIYRIRHTSKAADKIAEARAFFGMYKEGFQDHLIVLKSLAKQKADAKTVEQFLEAMFPLPTVDNNEKERQVQNMLDRRTEVESRFKNSPWNKTEATDGTAYGLFNAYTEWIDHGKEFRDTDLSSSGEKRTASILFGEGMTQKQKAFQVINQLV